MHRDISDVSLNYLLTKSIISVANLRTKITFWMTTMVLLYFIVKVKQKQEAVIGLASLKSFFKICLPKNGFVSDSKRFAVSRTSRLRCS